MGTVSGMFASQEDAKEAIRALEARGFDDAQISHLWPGDAHFGTPVKGKTMGAAVGGVLGAGLSTFLIPGLGPIAGAGLVASSLAGIGLGAAAGAAVDRRTAGIPNEDLFFFEEALRGGGAIVFVEARDPDQETQARNLLEHSGARTSETTRREWWQTVRGGERTYAHSRGYDFDRNEPDYRAGFEAALHPATRGRSLEECVVYVETCYPEPCRTEVFRIGFDRGQEYLRSGLTPAREAF
jgi:hypothetical protein